MFQIYVVGEPTQKSHKWLEYSSLIPIETIVKPSTVPHIYNESPLGIMSKYKTMAQRHSNIMNLSKWKNIHRFCTG